MQLVRNRKSQKFLVFLHKFEWTNDEFVGNNTKELNVVLFDIAQHSSSVKPDE